MHRSIGHFVVCFAILLSCAMAASDKPGFVEGHISIGPLTPVERAGASPPALSAEDYAALKVTVFKADGKTEVAQLAPDAAGNFRQSLAPGTYVLDMPHGRMTKVNLPKTVTIVSDRSVRVDIDIDTGIR
jgi:hypothetical protein